MTATGADALDELARVRSRDSYDWRQVQAWSAALDRPGGFQMFETARRALAQYGGLTLSAEGAGHEFAKASFVVDPMLALGEEERFARAAAELRAPLYPLGEIHGGNAFLAIDDQGRVYVLMDTAVLAGTSIHDALKALL